MPGNAGGRLRRVVRLNGPARLGETRGRLSEDRGGDRLVRSHSLDRFQASVLASYLHELP